jgi:hypothetical protein
MPTTDPDDPFGPRATTTAPPDESAAPDDPLGPRTPAAGTRAPADDPFGRPPESARPATATTPDDDPFGARSTTKEPAAKAPMDDPFAPRATDTQPPETKTSPLDDPFGPRTSEARPAETSGASKSEPDEPAAAKSAIDDPFAPKSDAAKATLDDPFAPADNSAKAPMSEVKDAPLIDASEPAKETTPSDDEKKGPSLDDPFAEPVGPKLSESVPATEPVEPADAMRVWIDATGKHRIRGQMKRILVAEGKVRILKESGKYTTVPLGKLSRADREFVAVHSREPSMLLAEKR